MSWTSAPYEPMLEVFEEVLLRCGDLGAACSVYLDGDEQAVLFGGRADPFGTPWTADTVTPIASATKGVAAAVSVTAVERGLLHPEAPVASYWPEFAQQHKDEISVSTLLGHAAGLPTLPEDFPVTSLGDVTRSGEVLAAAKPEWTPDRHIGYHALTFGMLVSQILVRATGRTPGDLLQDWLAGPLDADVSIGPLRRPRPVATWGPLQGTPAPPGDRFVEEMRSAASLSSRVFAPISVIAQQRAWDDEAFYVAEIPSSNGRASARGLARLYSALIPPARAGRLGVVNHPSQPSTDLVLHRELSYALGFQKATVHMPFSPSPSAFGHSGTGGAIAFADPEAGLAFAFVTNAPITGLLLDDRAAVLIEAAYRCAR
jgi:CubicO group peptidase (beta-lactamase class C family)